ncbi:hypothetical protein NMG60_11014440 [Bertholletia excelsa]
MCPPLSSIATPALQAFLSCLFDSLRRAAARQRPWPELADPAAFSSPENLSDAASRLRKNLSYFRVNYLAVLAAVFGFSLLSHLLSLLIILSLLAAWLCLYLFRASDRPVVALGHTLSDRETLVILIALTVAVIFLTSIGSPLMSAAFIGIAIVCAHGALRVPEDLFLDNRDGLGSGLFSFIGGAASSAAVAAAPSVVSRV